MKDDKDDGKIGRTCEKKDEKTFEPEKNQRQKNKETDEERHKRNMWWLKICLIVVGVVVLLGLLVGIVYKWYLKKLTEQNMRTNI